jgi:hypothetical protein
VKRRGSNIFLDNWLIDGGEVVGLTCRQHYRMFHKELYNLFQMLRLHLKAYKLSFVQDAFKCKRFRNTRHTATFGIQL